MLYSLIDTSLLNNVGRNQDPGCRIPREMILSRLFIQIHNKSWWGPFWAETHPEIRPVVFTCDPADKPTKQQTDVWKQNLAVKVNKVRCISWKHDGSWFQRVLVFFCWDKKKKKKKLNSTLFIQNHHCRESQTLMQTFFWINKVCGSFLSFEQKYIFTWSYK